MINIFLSASGLVATVHSKKYLSHIPLAKIQRTWYNAEKAMGYTSLIILGIDPGVATVGFGIVSANNGEIKARRCGIISTPAKTRIALRLKQINTDVSELIKTFKPDAIAVEELFFNTNQKTAIIVAQGRAAVILAGEEHGVPMFEYTPLQVKKAITGYGRAEKKQVMEMVQRLLALETLPKPDDAADALAIAICHARTSNSLLNQEQRI